MKKILFLALLISSIILYSQNTISSYPEGQNPYKSGNIELFKDINSWLIQNNEKPCEKNEIYWATLKIDETGKLFLIRNKSDQLNAEKNKCAYEMLVRVLGNLKNWQPAEINGKKVSSFFDFPFIPKDYFGNFKEDYDITKNANHSEFPGGINEFRKEVIKNLMAYLDYNSYRPRGKFVVLFNIDESGKIENIDIEPKVANSERFFDDIKFAIKRVKGKWEPAKINGTSVKSKFRFPINFGNGD